MTTLTPKEIEQMSRGQLINLVKRGIVKVMMSYPYTPTSQMTTKHETPEYQRVAHLRGREISISEASRKYGVPQVTITRWVQRGLIERLGTDKNRVMIDEADIAYCAEIRRQNPGAGRWLFNPDGTPYTPK